PAEIEQRAEKSLIIGRPGTAEPAGKFRPRLSRAPAREGICSVLERVLAGDGAGESVGALLADDGLDLVPPPALREQAARCTGVIAGGAHDACQRRTPALPERIALARAHAIEHLAQLARRHRPAEYLLPLFQRIEDGRGAGIGVPRRRILWHGGIEFLAQLSGKRPESGGPLRLAGPLGSLRHVIEGALGIVPELEVRRHRGAAALELDAAACAL